MAHLQEFHSVQSHELDLISSSSSNTSASPSLNSPPTSSSSVPSSPSVPSPSPSPPQPPPLPLQAEQQCFIVIPSAPASLCTSLIRATHYPTKKEALKSITESIPHAWMLANLLKSDSGYQKKASSHKKAVRRQSKEIYLIVSMYAVVQGAIFTAVAQSSIFTCTDRWGPASIVGVATLGTVIAVLNKLCRLGAERQEVEKSERRQSAVNSKIRLLYWRGSLCEIEALEPSHNVYFKEDAGRLGIFSARGLLVLGFLLGFSALMIVSSMLMLQCPPCRCHIG